MSGLDFEGLAAALLARSGEFVVSWLPGGRMEGREYVCGDIRGGPGDSFKVNLNTGKWADFASDIKGGDLVSLYAAIENIKQGEAAKKLADHIGFRVNGDSPGRASHVEHRLVPPPADASPPTMLHPKFGPPSMSWAYRGAAGQVLFCVARYDPPEGKQFCPWSWSETASRWVAKGWAAPRPLYGLDRLAANPGKHVLVVEGERAADAAQSIAAGAYVVVSWPNGAKAAEKADWSALSGRRVLIWPDADLKRVETKGQADKHGLEEGALIPYEYQPGVIAAQQIAGLLLPICEQVKVLNVGMDESRPDGWDAADAVASGWTWKQFFEWAKPKAALLVKAEAKAEAGAVVATAQVNVQITIDGDEPGSASLRDLWDSLGIALTGGGSPHANVDNVRRVLENYKPLAGIVWFDEFYQKMFTGWNSGSPRQWTDVDDINLLTYLQRKVGLAKVSLDATRQAVTGFAKQHVRNEPREWMESLKWDGQSRVHEFLSDYFGCEHNEYTSAASKNFWVGMVARIFLPGCKLDNMLVLEGAQGTFKSTALDIIGGKWYLQMSESVHTKDFFLCLHGKMLVEIAELDSFYRADITRIKQVITQRTDNYRSPYDRVSVDHPRMSVFAATTNEKLWSRDQTGARRFWPVESKAVNLDRISNDRAQLFAEAVHLLAPQTPWSTLLKHFEGGLDWWVMPKEETEREQEDRRQSDEWESVIYDFLRNRDEVTIRDIAREVLGINLDKLDRALQMRVAGIVKNLGWKNQRGGPDGFRGKIWTRPEIKRLL